MKWLLAILVVLAPCALAAQWDEGSQTFTPGDGQVVLYDNYLCKGEPFMVLQRGRTFNDFRSYSAGSGSWNDRASCIHVGPNTKVTIYQHINFGGSKKEFSRTRTNPDGKWSLKGDWWDNSASSAEVP